MRSSCHIAGALLLLHAGLAAAAEVEAAAPGPPTAAVVLLGGDTLGAKETDVLLTAAIDEMRDSSGYALDAMRSLQAAAEARLFECGLSHDCLLKVADTAEVDAVLAVQVTPEGRRTLHLEVLWVAADARGVPGQSERKVRRRRSSLERAVKAAVKRVIPAYARKGVGALTVLAQAGSEVLVDGQSAGTAPMAKPVILSAGVHRVDVVTPSGDQVTKSVEVREARRTVADLPVPVAAVAALTAPEEEQKGTALRTASFVMGGAGVLAFGGGLYFGLQAQGLNRQITGGACQDTPCTAGLTQREAHALYETASGRATLGNVGVTTGALMLAGAAVMYLLSEEGPQAQEGGAGP